MLTQLVRLKSATPTQTSNPHSKGRKSECFKFKQLGHWAKECSLKPANHAKERPCHILGNGREMAFILREEKGSQEKLFKQQLMVPRVGCRFPAFPSPVSSLR